MESEKKNLNRISWGQFNKETTVYFSLVIVELQLNKTTLWEQDGSL